ncbi:hypothetical protein CU102_13550 [Phyllobacterium brassicacearum]|uniref:Bacterial transcriptional activator domain-containing protein n=1 Tax=Phyllobacterium brassicacearum TaxID=314235 RepID=A0A2P7BPD8_9HYPH|nr:BTAD domain-containing putative transcriptional regulator [Phyllobacterium brassicacearum]PSH68322.1 hypothetical protein CU102_13550 [Phyllobacterium brassicacearum]TDQ31821.1 TolB-like protein [Phyllobacterium brassicacearum]
MIQRGEPGSLASAADLYQGDLLDGLTMPEQLDQWFAPYRSAYRRKALELVDRLSRTYPAVGTTEELACERLAERLVASDPTAEEAHRALIRLYLNRGKANAALRQFRSFRDALQRELGVEPLIAEHRENGERPANPTPPPAVEAPPAAVQRDTDHPSVVVLPFENLSGPGDEYFVDGVVEEITAMLSRVRSFFVIARQSAFAYKGRRVDVREIGKEFGVSYAVEGTVRRAADRVRIFVQLADTGTRTQLWSERFDRAASDIFELEDEIAARVAGAVRPALLHAEIEAARRKPPDSLRAYELVLTALPKIWSATAEGNRQAIALLREAIAIDPDFGRAHALLGWCHAQDIDWLWSSDPEADRELTLAAISAASRLGVSNDPMALTAQAAAVLQCLADPDRAAAYVEEALWLDPNNAWAWGGAGWIAVHRDRPETARENFERALTLSPLDPLEYNFRMGIAWATALEGDYALAAKLTQRVLDKNPRVTWALFELVAYSALAGDLVTARDAVGKLRAADPNVSISVMRSTIPRRHVSRLFDVLVEGYKLAGLLEE